MKPRIPLPALLGTAPFTARQGIDAGLGRNRMRGPDLHHPFRGVLVPGPADDRVVARCRALQLRLPSYAFFCGITAAVVMGIPLPTRSEQSRTLHVAVPAPHRAPTGRGLHGHSIDAASVEVRMWGGLRLSGPERVWCDLGAVLDLPDLVAVGDYLIHWQYPVTSADALQSAVADYAPRRGIRNLREALPFLHERSESRRESLLRVILVRAGFRGLVVNLPIKTSGGFHYRADLAFPERKVLVEYQSAFHEGPTRFRADMTRISRLEADGWFVIQVNADDLGNPAELIARVAQVLAERGGL